MIIQKLIFDTASVSVTSDKKVLQLAALSSSMDSMDSVLATWILAAVMLNSIISPLLYHLQWKGCIIAADSLLDCGYTILNVVRLLNRKATILDFASLTLPLLSITFLIYSYSEWVISQTDAMVEWRRGELRRKRSWFLGIASPQSRQKKAHWYFFMFRGMLTFICVLAGTFSAVQLLRIRLQHAACVDLYSSCLWRHAHPRILLPNGAFGATSCGEDHVRVINATFCKTLESVDFSTFKNISEVYFDSSLAAFPKSFVSLLAIENIQPMFEMPRMPSVFDISGLGLTAIPKSLLEWMRIKTGEDVASKINLSHNNFDNAGIAEFAKAIACKSGPCKLRLLDLSHNVFQNIPESILFRDPKFPNLKTVFARGNNITVIGPEVSFLFHFVFNIILTFLSRQFKPK